MLWPVFLVQTWLRTMRWTNKYRPLMHVMFSGHCRSPGAAQTHRSQLPRVLKKYIWSRAPNSWSVRAEVSPSRDFIQRLVPLAPVLYHFWESENVTPSPSGGMNKVEKKKNNKKCTCCSPTLGLLSAFQYCMLRPNLGATNALLPLRICSPLLCGTLAAVAWQKREVLYHDTQKYK